MFGLYGTPRGRTTGPHHCHQSSTPGPHAGPRSSIPDLALRAQPTLPAGSTLVGSLGSGGVAIPHAHDCELHEETNPSGFGTCASSHPRYDLRMLATISGHRSGSFSSHQCHVDPHPCLVRLSPPNWVAPIRPLLRTDCSWSIYTDASWREIHPIPVEAVFGIQGSHQGSGALFLLADLSDWCSDILAIRFDIPPTLRWQGSSALVAELLAVHTGLHLLHTLHLRSTVFSDCLSAVKKITRRWSPGLAYTEAGASLVTSCRSYLSDTISLKWIKGHPERSDTPHLTWSRHQWGNYIADGLSKNRDIGSLPHSPIPTIRTHIIPLADILARVPAMDVWQWVGPDRAPPLGHLRHMLSHHRSLAYRANRDSLRGLRGAPPI